MIIRALRGGKQTAQTANGSELLKSVLSIKTIPLRDFVNASCYGSEHIPNWNDLLSQYYTAKGDNRAMNICMVVAEMKAIEYRAKLLDHICNSMTIGYDFDIAALLRVEFPMFAFTKDTYIEEMQHIVSIEKNNKVHYDMLAKQLQDMQQDGEKETTPDERYKAFTKMRQAINKHVGHAEITLDSPTYDFAVAYGELEKYHEEQSSKNKNAG